MSTIRLDAGFIPLVDAAPLIACYEMGFAREEGLDLHLKAYPSWSSLRDALCFGQLDAAHMLASVPVASALGLVAIVIVLTRPAATALCLLAVWLWFALMTKEFFAAQWLKARPILYLVSHMAILPLIDLMLTSLEWAGWNNGRL